MRGQAEPPKRSNEMQQAEQRPLQINVIGWRECGDDDDSVHVSLGEPGADPIELIRAEQGWDEDSIEVDEDTKERTHNGWPVFITSQRSIGNDHLFYDHATGRQFRITIDEIDVCIAGSPAVNGQCGDPDCVCAPEGDEYAADDTSRDALLDRLGKAVANLHDEDLLKLIERIAI